MSNNKIKRQGANTERKQLCMTSSVGNVCYIQFQDKV